MRRTHPALLLSLSLLLLCLLCLTSCGDGEEVHTHTWSGWRVSVASTHDTEGTEIRTCMICGEEETRPIAAQGHTYSEEWDFSLAEHWHSCTCGAIIDAGAHDFSEGDTCSVCHVSRDILCYTKSGGVVTFGSYPQTLMTDAALLDALDALAGALPTAAEPLNWNSYDYEAKGSTSDTMWYQDVTYEGSTYRGVYFISYRPISTVLPAGATNSEQDDNGFLIRTTYWFRFDPITWRILRRTDGNALILADLILDAQPYQSSYEQHVSDNSQQEIYYTHSNGAPGGTLANSYTYSTIRTFLLNDFYHTAFTQEEASIILPASISGEMSAVSETGDPIFLMSYTEASVYLGTREKPATSSSDYARCQGLLTMKETLYDGNGSFWLRTAVSKNTSNVYVISGGGTATRNFARNTSVGVLPALWIPIE